MLTNLLPLIMAGTLSLMEPAPLITEVGVFGGPYWPEESERDFIRMTAGIATYTSLSAHFGFELAAAYKGGGKTWDCWPCTGEYDDGRTLQEHLDLSVLVQARIPIGRVSLRGMLGPSVGLPVMCREHNLTRETKDECNRSQADLRVVAGAGAAVRMSPRIDLAVSYRFVFDPHDIGLDVDGGSDPIASALIAAVSYRRGG